MEDGDGMSICRTLAHGLIVAAVCLLPVACSGDERTVVIGPIFADITIQDTSTTDPAVYFEKAGASADMIMVDVKLRTPTPTDYDAFNLEIRFDPGHVQISQVFGVPTSLGACSDLTGGCSSASLACNPAASLLCCVNAVNANGTGDLIIGVSAPAGCTKTSSPPDETLLQLVFLAATTGTSRLQLVDAAGSGDCEILQADPVIPNALNDLMIPCLDGMAEITSTR
jgi:hypothetical protein